ncbi:MAG: hypothetical protein JSU73_01490 [candidate division WOR-3 bacterium]|nr:MAG: hypothetical protein JSU73_01490 [candidate division WOR-3 bacterium]
MNRIGLTVGAGLLALMLLQSGCSTATGSSDSLAQGSYAETGILEVVEVLGQRPDFVVDEVVVTAEGPGLDINEVVVRAFRPVPLKAQVSDLSPGGDLAN